MKESFLAIIDASYANTHLYPFTTTRCTGAIPILAKFRTIDFTISALVNAEVTNLAIFPGEKISSLNYHLRNGAPWHLDTSKDGIFIFDVGSYSIDPIVSYNHIRKNEDFLKRSSQEYVILAHSNAVHSLDFDKIKKSHLNSKCDITKVTKNGEDIYVYILKKDLLSELVDESIKKFENNLYDTVAKNVGKYTINEHESEDYYQQFNNVIEYYKVCMNLIKEMQSDEQFAIDVFNSQIKTSKNHMTPAKFSDHTLIRGSIVGNGTVVSGECVNSIIFRKVKIENNAKVINSIIMDGALIGENCIIENAIIEKNAVIKPNVIVRGTEDLPRLVLRNEVV